MISFSSLLLDGSIRTMKSGVLLENIDLVERDSWGKYRVRGYVQVNSIFDAPRYEQRWTIIDTDEIDFYE